MRVWNEMNSEPRRFISDNSAKVAKGLSILQQRMTRLCGLIQDAVLNYGMNVEGKSLLSA